MVCVLGAGTFTIGVCSSEVYIQFCVYGHVTIIT